jgi:hypothetical protein
MQAVLRALGAEAEALQKIHVRIQRQLQNLEVCIVVRGAAATALQAS